MLEIGSLVDGKYKILNKIGQGGMSIVYLAMNERANKQWAIKEVRKDGVQNFQVVKQGVVAETEMLKKLNHPNLPSIVDVIDGEGTLLIVMDYIEGQHLESVVTEYGAQSQEDVLQWAKQLCDVLAYLHSRKPPIIYRDMKPSNIMLKPDGKVMLIDFGIAREFKENSRADTTCLGTQGYAAPEQYGGRGQTDARTDIYCLGATLYHLLTGHNPSEPPYALYPIRYWNPRLSSGLEKIILKCTQKNPHDRYQNCGELMHALEHYHELDTAYRRKQTLKWRTFLCTVVLTVLFGMAAAGFRVAENTVMARTYGAYVEEADNLASTDPGRCVKYYKNAIALDPSEGTAYEGLLEFFLWKNNESRQDKQTTAGSAGEGQESQRTGRPQVICVFSDAEEQEMRRVLGTQENRNKSNEEYLTANRADYEKFAYDMGIAYYFSYNETGNKGAAKKWLEIASEAKPSEELNETMINRAKNLYKISEYYDGLGMRNQAGDSMMSFSGYWKDLMKIVDDDSDGGNNVNMLLSYKEMTSQIVQNAANFKRAGITRWQMEDKLSDAADAVDRIKIITGSANAEYEQELKENLEETLDTARTIINSTFNTDNLAADT
ncbi:MAG TPA: serine/threonine protein kinase [Candidatus Blautia merdigallinarum]|uniref:Serine/threonine protein kinase n=1 Tax=Candidatus Blautia merdigallinarum TaxID=2838495 RepID=A0A9D2N5R9_9FIRM|nr:serine/threonine protein kinase [Candidatus Blautia merdigallinarum]